MSGIVGIVNLDGAPVDRDLLLRMTNCMSYRGPDAQDTWIDGNVGFGHTLLRTSCETGLMSAAVGNVWITGDVRIDGAESADLKDAERIAHAYETWGEQCVDHLIGDFAFAIWDKRAQRLFCARDHFGVKPFFFARVANSLIFSNTLNVLRLDTRVSDALNETAIGDYLACGLNQDLATTTFRDIQRLPPAHTLSLANGSLTTRRYWTPEVKNEIRFRDAQSYVDRFNELFATAVGDRLRTNRVSISMSGGLDSTSIAVTARDLLQQTGAPAVIQAYSTVYDELIPDQERHYSTLAAESIGVPIYHLSADDYTLFQGDLNQAEPFLVSPLGGQFNDLLRLMAGTGRVALTGYDGDALMNERGGVRPLLSGIKRIKKELISPKRPATLRALQSKVWVPLFEGYDPGSTRLPLDVRHPFIDIRLVDYVLSIPTRPWCVNKHLLRQAMKDRLPRAIVDRPKTPLAGDPVLQLSRRASVRWLDTFQVTPQLTRFVNLKSRRSLAEEETPNDVWANVRLFALNHWLAHSLPLDRRMVA
jgi:asparagine synthase (glutamine-hydrolysing)